MKKTNAINNINEMMSELTDLRTWAMAWPRRTRVQHQSVALLKRVREVLAVADKPNYPDEIFCSMETELRCFIDRGIAEKKSQTRKYPELCK